MSPAQLHILERERAVLVFVQRWYVEHGDPPRLTDIELGRVTPRRYLWLVLRSLESQGLISHYGQCHWFPVPAGQAWVNGREYLVSPW